jgi:uncharacterized protein
VDKEQGKKFPAVGDEVAISPREGGMRERTKRALVAAAFAGCWFLPVDAARFWGALQESLALVRWYAREHVLLCLVPAFIIAGAISVFVSQGAVMKYLGPTARKWVAYPVASVSGTILAVCSCTVSCRSSPAFTSVVRGWDLPRRSSMRDRPSTSWRSSSPPACWGRGWGSAGRSARSSSSSCSGSRCTSSSVERRRLAPAEGETGLWADIYAGKWLLTGVLGVMLGGSLYGWFQREELSNWVDASWGFAKQLLPFLLAGVMVAGFLLGGPEGSERGLVPNAWVQQAVGGNSPSANLFAAMAGACALAAEHAGDPYRAQPLAVTHQSAALLPSLYGIGTALPVVGFALVIGFAAHRLGRAFNALTILERWMRRVTAVVFLCVGAYYCLVYLAGVL